MVGVIGLFNTIVRFFAGGFLAFSFLFLFLGRAGISSRWAWVMIILSSIPNRSGVRTLLRSLTTSALNYAPHIDDDVI